MPISLSPMMMRQIIMDHYENPQYKHAPEGDLSKYEQVHMDSANCIDDIIVYVLVKGWSCLYNLHILNRYYVRSYDW